MRWPGEAQLVGALTLALAHAGLAGCSGEDAGPTARSDPADGGGAQTAACGAERLTYESFGGPFFLDWCTGCHSSQLAEYDRQGAPLGIDFDTLEGIVEHRDRIVARVVNDATMPPVGGPSAGDRARLEQWLGCGAPVEREAFSPAPPPGGGPAPGGPDPRGACAEPKAPLPPDLLPRCTADTGACVAACSAPDVTDAPACRDACLGSDPTPLVVHEQLPLTCSTCTFWQMVSCGSRSGCAPEAADVSCCLDECLASAEPNCFATRCAAALSDFIVCVAVRAPGCVDYDSPPISDCYATP